MPKILLLLFFFVSGFFARGHDFEGPINRFLKSHQFDKIVGKSYFETDLGWVTVETSSVKASGTRLSYKIYPSESEAKDGFNLYFSREQMLSRFGNFSIGEEYFVLGINRIISLRGKVVVKIGPVVGDGDREELKKIARQFDEVIHAIQQSSP